MNILAIETSHDDTSLSIMSDGKILELITFSQIDVHKKYGGVVPEIASREHVSNIALVIDQMKALFDFSKLDQVVYTNEPGLIGALHIGALAANAISLSLSIPCKGVNHLVGHMLSAGIEHKIIFPMISLIASGGHTQIIYAKSPNDFEVIGETQDDAIGETFDKVARKLGLPFPGGPEIDKLSIEEFPKLFSTPMQNNELNMSFSGLKSKVISHIHNKQQRGEDVNVVEIASAFQFAAIDQVISKMHLAIKKYNPKSITIGGGVASNTLLRKNFLELPCQNSFIPSQIYTVDNAAMIANAFYLMEKI